MEICRKDNIPCAYEWLGDWLRGFRAWSVKADAMLKRWNNQRTHIESSRILTVYLGTWIFFHFHVILSDYISSWFNETAFFSHFTQGLGTKLRHVSFNTFVWGIPKDTQKYAQIRLDFFCLKPLYWIYIHMTINI